MSGEEKERIDETLVNMITNLKPKVTSEFCTFNFGTPSIKRNINSSGFFDVYTPPSKLIKTEASFAYLGSPREIRRLRNDLIECRNNITNLEHRIEHMHSVRKEMEIMFNNELTALKQHRKWDSKSISELEQQLQVIRKREADLKDEVVEIRYQYDSLKITMDKRVEELEKAYADFKSEAVVKESLKNEDVRVLTQKVEELQVVVIAAQEDADAQRNLAAEFEKRLAEQNAIGRELELKEQALKKAHLDLKDFEYFRDNYLEFQQQMKTQQQKLLTYGDMEKEIQVLREDTAKLKEQVKNKLLLEEEVNDLKGRLVHYKEQEAKLATLEAKQLHTDMYLNEWRTVARGLCESNAPDSTLPYVLRSNVERLQQQEIALSADKAQLQSQLNIAVHEGKVASSEAEKSQKHAADMQKTIQQHQNLIHRMQKKLLLISRERDSYRLQLDSYEKDLTMTINSTNPAQATVHQAQRERIENLERIIEGYRDMMTKLETDLKGFEPNSSTELVPVRIEQMSRLQSEVDQLKLQNDQLRERRDHLEIQLENLMVGSDTNSGRIVHLTKNPLSKSIEQRDNAVEKLLEEVERLKRKIRNLEEGQEASKLGDLTLNPQEITALKEQLKSSETQIQRLKDYFKSSMQEFRNVIYMLLGYKVDKNNSHYKLTSMYAHQEGDQICFQLDSEGGLSLLENEFSSSVEDLVELYLVNQKSIPVFLSAITVDLFNNHTVASKTFVGDNA